MFRVGRGCVVRQGIKLGCVCASGVGVSEGVALLWSSPSLLPLFPPPLLCPLPLARTHKAIRKRAAPSHLSKHLKAARAPPTPSPHFLASSRRRARRRRVSAVSEPSVASARAVLLARSPSCPKRAVLRRTPRLRVALDRARTRWRRRREATGRRSGPLEFLERERRLSPRGPPPSPARCPALDPPREVLWRASPLKNRKHHATMTHASFSPKQRTTRWYVGPLAPSRSRRQPRSPPPLSALLAFFLLCHPFDPGTG